MSGYIYECAIPVQKNSNGVKSSRCRRALIVAIHLFEFEYISESLVSVGHVYVRVVEALHHFFKERFS